MMKHKNADVDYDVDVDVNLDVYGKADYDDVDEYDDKI